MDFCFCGAILASVFTVLAFRHCVTHVGSAGRPYSLYSRSLFFSSGPFLLLLSYFLLRLGKPEADCTVVVVVVVVVVFTLKAVPISAQYSLTSVLVQLTRTPSVVAG